MAAKNVLSPTPRRYPLPAGLRLFGVLRAPVAFLRVLAEQLLLLQLAAPGIAARP